MMFDSQYLANLVKSIQIVRRSHLKDYNLKTGKRGNVLCLPTFYCIVTIQAPFEGYLRWIVTLLEKCLIAELFLVRILPDSN